MDYPTLLNKFEAAMTQISKNFDAFPWEDPKAYADWCVQTHGYVSHSTRLLALAAAHFPLDQNNLHYRFLKHCKEESGHEILALRDLKEMGFRREDFFERVETANLYQSQYFHIQNVSPYAFFGYILLLEGAAATVGSRIHKRASTAHGDRATNFWRTHADEDPSHIKDAFKHIEALEPWTFPCVIQNFEESLARYSAMLASIALDASSAREKAS
jgi:hypothetical protein